jgi:hypothetical protein
VFTENQRGAIYLCGRARHASAFRYELRCVGMLWYEYTVGSGSVQAESGNVHVLGSAPMHTRVPRQQWSLALMTDMSIADCEWLNAPREPCHGRSGGALRR